MSINKATLTKIVNGNTEYIYPKTTSDLVQYGSSTVKDILDGLNSTYLQLSGGALSGDIQILKNTSYIRTLISSIGSSIIMGNNDSYYSIGYTNQDGEFYISIDGNPIIQCAGGNAIFNGNADSATKDGNGNNIVNTYLKKTDASSKYVTTTNGIAYGYLHIVSDETDNANLTVRSLDDGYSNIFIGNSTDRAYCSITLDPNNIFSLKYNGSSVITATSVNNIKFYGIATKATQDGNGNTISTTYLKKTDITQSDVMGSILVNGEYIEVYDDSEIYAELDSTYLKKTDASSTYLKLTGGTITGALNINGALNVYSDINFLDNSRKKILWNTLSGNHNITMRTFGDTNDEKWAILADNSTQVLTVIANNASASTFAGTSAKATADSSGTKLSIDAGDELSFNGIYAGHLAGGAKNIQFFIPTARIIHGTLTCTTMTCVIRHADGGYLYARSGSTGDTYTQLGSGQTSIWASSKTVRTNEITSITCTNKTDGVSVDIQFNYQLAKSSGDTTSATNNAPITMQCAGKITSS